MSREKPMRRRLITASLLLGGLALVAACGSGGPSVQARQTGETTTTTEPTTTTEAPATTSPAPTTAVPPVTTAALPGEPPCTASAPAAAHAATFGDRPPAL